MVNSQKLREKFKNTAPVIVVSLHFNLPASSVWLSTDPYDTYQEKHLRAE